MRGVDYSCDLMATEFQLESSVAARMTVAIEDAFMDNFVLDIRNIFEHKRHPKVTLNSVSNAMKPF
jgi:hypothetical protein